MLSTHSTCYQILRNLSSSMAQPTWPMTRQGRENSYSTPLAHHLGESYTTKSWDVLIPSLGSHSLLCSQIPNNLISLNLAHGTLSGRTLTPLSHHVGNSKRNQVSGTLCYPLTMWLTCGLKKIITEPSQLILNWEAMRKCPMTASLERQDGEWEIAGFDIALPPSPPVPGEWPMTTPARLSWPSCGPPRHPVSI